MTLRYRIWLIARTQGLGAPSAFEWEVTQGNETESGQQIWTTSGAWAYAGDFAYHNETDNQKAPVYYTDPIAAMRVWMGEPTGYVDITDNSDEIIWTPPYNIAEKFCPGTVGQLKMTGEDHFTEYVYIQTGTDADLPPVGEWDAGVEYKYGYTQWREVELCKE